MSDFLDNSSVGWVKRAGWLWWLRGHPGVKVKVKGQGEVWPDLDLTFDLDLDPRMTPQPPQPPGPFDSPYTTDNLWITLTLGLLVLTPWPCKGHRKNGYAKMSSHKSLCKFMLIISLGDTQLILGMADPQM